MNSSVCLKTARVSVSKPTMKLPTTVIPRAWMRSNSLGEGQAEVHRLIHVVQRRFADRLEANDHRRAASGAKQIQHLFVVRDVECGLSRPGRDLTRLIKSGISARSRSLVYFTREMKLSSTM